MEDVRDAPPGGGTGSEAGDANIGGGSLQFDRAEYDQDGAGGLRCAGCKREIHDAYFTVNQATVCVTCRERLAAALAAGGGWRRAFKAVALGGIAAVLGAILYLAVVYITGYELGLIAIVVGFIVGAAVRMGSEGRGGLGYQLLAVVLTYTSIVTMYVPSIHAQIQSQMRQDTAGAAPADQAAHPAPSARSQGPAARHGAGPAARANLAHPGAQTGAHAGAGDASGAADPSGEPMPGLARTLLGLSLYAAFLYAFAFCAPFLMLSEGSSSIMGLVIIGIGLYQAWQVNRATSLVVKGPFQVAARLPEPTGAGAASSSPDVSDV